MSTVITATATTDKSSYTSGEQISVTIPGASAVSTTDTTRHLSLTLTADDGTSEQFSADVAGQLVKQLGVKITAVELDGVAGTVATDGQSAVCTAA